MKPIETKIGVVIVSYNASEAVQITLESVRLANNDASMKLILVDNASETSERAKIRAAISQHMAETGSSWRYIEQEKNLGFSGGNNAGIVEFLSDEDITHICLLNSDVIVTDHWLDRLLATGSDMVSGVTNKADSEQCVPVDYQVEIEQCLEGKSGKINDKVIREISDFSERWYAAWRGNWVETDVTFFCVLMTKAVCRDVGLLDETFFPGGFEDDDYCHRVRTAGFRIHLARDVFIHHWGSASFGRLQYEYFSERAQCNKEYLEKKHGIVWQRRSEKPIVSFTMDIDFILKHSDRLSKQKPFIGCYIENISRQIDYFESEFRNLRKALSASKWNVPVALDSKVLAAESYGDLKDLWGRVVKRTTAFMEGKDRKQPEMDSLLSDLRHLSAGVHDRVDCNFDIYGFISTPDQQNTDTAPPTTEVYPPSASAPVFPSRPTTRVGKFIWILRRGYDFIRRFDGIVFFGGYFYPERQNDGYFQRIQAVDRLFTDRWRVYVESDELRGRNVWFDRPEPNVLVLRIIGSWKRKMLVRILALLTVFRSRKIYFHSVLRMYDNRFGHLLRVPLIRKAVDIHGVVPEEFRMHNDFFSAVLYEKEEKLAVKKAGIVISVTDTMSHYFIQKYRDALKAKLVSFPIFPNFIPTLESRPLVDGKPIVVYAGGLHKWQQVPKMIDAIVRTADHCRHRFYCPEPQIVKDMLPLDLSDDVTVESKTHAELMDIYPECHYGFILREDIIVNRAACPTKLVEYLAMGIIPIVDSEEVGDFKTLGMRSISLNDFLSGRLPHETLRIEMATENLSVYEKLKDVRQSGSAEIQAYFTTGKGRGWGKLDLMNMLRRIFPLDTRAGRVARRIRRSINPGSVGLTSIDRSANPLEAGLPAEDFGAPAACDILVQVDNFEAGGLENVVIDLNSTLGKAGFSVTLLVLGNQGGAVQRARELGQHVICCEYSQKVYMYLLDHLKPKLVLAHYSFHGVPLCLQKSVPFVQVIHNVYMWFNERQRLEFEETAAMTTAFVAVSHYVKHYSVSRLGVPSEKCVVIPNGIDLEPFMAVDKNEARTRLRAFYGMGDDEFVFLDIGAINHQKNHLAMVKAFEIASRTCSKARLMILGPCYEDGLLKEILAYIDKNALKGKVIYCGSAPSAHDYLAMADAFVSSAFFEGAQLSLLEGIAANIPVVTPAVGSASGFANRRGIRLVEPVYDLVEYKGAIWEMKSTEAFEQRLGEAMVATWRKPVRPDFSETELAALEKGRAYERYTGLITDIIEGEFSTDGDTIIPNKVEIDVNSRFTLYNMVRSCYWVLPAPLRNRLNGVRHFLVRWLRSCPGKTVPGKNDLSWSEFRETVLNRTMYRDIIILEPSVDWGILLFQRPHHMALALGRLGCLVIFKTTGDGMVGFRAVAENVWIANDPEVKAIHGAVRCFYSTSQFLDAEDMRNAGNHGRVVYEYIDLIDASISGGRDSLRRLERLKRTAFEGGADMIVASAAMLYDEAVAYGGTKRCFLIPNGVDVRHYRDVKHHTIVHDETLKTFRAKYRGIVGYFGAIAPWLWYEVINQVAALMPDVGFIFIGPDYSGCVPKLSRKGNVLYLGAVGYETLPAYARWFDVCFIPFQPGEIARSTSPLKLFEYFALEKPVVVTGDMDECTAFSEVFSGNDAEGLAEAISRAFEVCDNTSYQARLGEIAEANTWDVRAEAYLTALEKI